MLNLKNMAFLLFNEFHFTNALLQSYSVFFSVNIASLETHVLSNKSLSHARLSACGLSYDKFAAEVTRWEGKFFSLMASNFHYEKRIIMGSPVRPQTETKTYHTFPFDDVQVCAYIQSKKI
jgi:hypothetical protein